MPKMKTKSGAKKRFKLTGRGKVKSGQAFTSHMMTNKPASMKRKARRTGVLSVADARIVLKSFLPYAGKKKSAAPKAAKGGK
ncbi:MAG: 50S ribosomal protein L35 [Alphaproteobacteria bacterium]|nr:50S ribosomal protein L35 [Alphaproteobacteria bacterium]